MSHSNQPQASQAIDGYADPLNVARAQALFVSDLPSGSQPSSAEVRQAIRSAVRTCGDFTACAREVSAARAKDPDATDARMRWALDVVNTVYGPVHRSSIKGLVPRVQAGGAR
jgi:hypothetical protein